MPRRQRARRFVPRYPVVSQSVVDEEAKYLAREVENMLVLSLADLRKSTDERYSLASKAWAELQQSLQLLADRDAEALRSILFRDIFHTLACCQSFCHSHAAESTPRIIPDPVAVERHEKFSEWLFTQSERR